MDVSLPEKVATITGAAHGIGKATAIAFAQAGARVALVDTDGPGVEAAASEVEKTGGTALAIQGSVADRTAVEEAVARVISSFGRVDILVNSAAVGIITPMVSVSVEDWDLVINTNLRGTFLVTRAVLPHMLAQKSGNIINIASVDGLKGRGGGAAYCASKAAVIRFTESLADEVAKYKIRANVICPAGVNTQMWRKHHPEADPLSVLQPEEVADAILFLASEKSRSLNGATIEMLGPRLEWATYL